MEYQRVDEIKTTDTAAVLQQSVLQRPMKWEGFLYENILGKSQGWAMV